jgi:Ca2+-binding EF-hand superfamily protein
MYRVFDILDENGDGVLDFREFVISVWNYCLTAKAGLITFVFDMYDENHTGTIDHEEFENVLQDFFEGQDIEENELSKYCWTSIIIGIHILQCIYAEDE